MQSSILSSVQCCIFRRLQKFLSVSQKRLEAQAGDGAAFASERGNIAKILKFNFLPIKQGTVFENSCRPHA